jgi:hypothetical protein
MLRFAAAQFARGSADFKHQMCEALANILPSLTPTSTSANSETTRRGDGEQNTVAMHATVLM